MLDIKLDVNKVREMRDDRTERAMQQSDVKVQGGTCSAQRSDPNPCGDATYETVGLRVLPVSLRNAIVRD